MPYTPAPKFSSKPSPKESLIDLDKDILKLLARRANMLKRLCDDKGRLEASLEKSLRAAWERNAGRMSRDTRLSRQLFALLQEVEFMPRPVEGEERRPAFALTPLRRPVEVCMAAPLACRRSRLYLALAAASGSVCDIRPSLLNDLQTECIKMFNQAGAALLWDEDGTLRAREGGGLTLADKVIFVGDDALNLYLMVGQYVGWHSRVKFTGESALKLADFTALQQFLPLLGARLVNVIPKSGGLPLRLECSGMVPDSIAIPPDLPADAVTGLLMAAPFWERPVTIDLKDHPEAQAILEEACTLLRECKANIVLEEQRLRVTPGGGGGVRVPHRPPLGMDMTLAAYLLALPALAGGTVRLEGICPQCAVADTLRVLLEQAGIVCTVDAHSITAHAPAPTFTKDETSTQIPWARLDAASLPLRFAPLALAIAGVRALDASAPQPLPALPADMDMATVESFFAVMGLAVQDALLIRAPLTDTVWSAPNPSWAMALALAAYGRRALKLGNPGVMTSLYPSFWSFYNSLPNPARKKMDVAHDTTENAPSADKPVRRRIVAGKPSGTGSGDTPA